LTCRHTKKFIWKLWHILELTSFIFWIIYNTVLDPGTVDLMGFFIFRILRVMKIHTVFKLEDFRKNIAIFSRSLQLVYTSYGTLTGVLMFIIFFFSLLIYVFERGEFISEERIWVRNTQEGESPLSNLYACIYFIVVTMTTLGYGDITAKSYMGRLISMISVLVGLVNLTFLINIIGDCFEEVFRVFVMDKSRIMEEEKSVHIEKQIKRATTDVSKMQRMMSKRSETII